MTAQKKRIRPLNDSAKKENSKKYQCIVTNIFKPRHELIRFVVDNDGIIFPDIAEKLPSEGCPSAGCYVTASPEHITAARDGGKLAESLNGQFKPEHHDSLSSLIDQLLLKRGQEGLALGRRGGITLGGGGKIRAVSVAIGLLIARDASMREARALCGDVEHQWVMQCLYSHELGVPFGRQALAFAAVLPASHHGNDRLIQDLWRLAHYRGQGFGSSP